MAAKSNYFKESGLHTWHFHSVGKRKSPLAAFGLPPERSCTYKVQLCDLCQGFYRNLRLFWFHQPSHSNKIPILPNSFSKLKPLRRVAFRYDTLAGKFLAMVQLASRRLSLPIILQIILPLGLVVRPAPVAAASLILPGLALAGTDKGKGNDGQNNGNQNGKTKNGDPGVSSVPETNPVIVLIPFVGAVLLVSSLQLLRRRSC
jgi:hypothetical protein